MARHHAVAALGLAAIAAVALRRRRRAERDRAAPPTMRATVHAWAEPSPLPALGAAPQAAAAPPAAARLTAAAAAAAAATLLLLGVAGLLVAGQQLALAGALAAAWALAAGGQVLARRDVPLVARRRSGGSLGEADALVEIGGGELELPPKLPDIAGTWIKDGAASDSMDAAMGLIRLNGVMRTAVRLIKGVRIQLDEGHFDFAVFSVIRWFTVHERYALGGAPSRLRRRDLRRGGSTGAARLTRWGSVVLQYEWGAPHAGRGVDEFSLDEAGRLRVATTITVGGQSASYTQIYARR
ncbi:hypothetical protein HT031_006365 [Scenedesmus sp. PABB004]|nr:hypothetical protein HT031_006365 [Scenedesmus sp. PABB004]